MLATGDGAMGGGEVAYRFGPLWRHVLGLRRVGHPGRAVVGGWWGGEEVSWVAGSSCWDGIDCRNWVSCSKRKGLANLKLSRELYGHAA